MSTPSIHTPIGYTAHASPIAPAVQSVPDRLTAMPTTAVEKPPSGGDSTRMPSMVMRQTDQDLSAQKTAPRDEPQMARPDVKTLRKTDIDWQTNELVFRVIDSRNGQVVRQSPEEALLRLRAYAKQVLAQTEHGQNGFPQIARDL